MQQPAQSMLPHQMPQLHHHQHHHHQHQQQQQLLQMQHQQPPLGDPGVLHPGTIMDPSQMQRVAAGPSSMHLPKHLQHMSAAGGPLAGGPGACMDMVDWRTGPGGAPVGSMGPAGCPPMDLEPGIQQYRHHGPTSAAGMYPHPAPLATSAAAGPPVGVGMNGLLHHSQQPGALRRLPGGAQLGPSVAGGPAGPGYPSCPGPAYPASMGPQYGGVPGGAAGGGKPMLPTGPMGLGPDYGRTLSK